MAAENIQRSIKRGTGELEGATIEEYMYEGYGPGGAAVIVKVATDNKNRSVSDIRHLFGKNGGNLAEPGAVAWMFEMKSSITVDGEKATEDQLMSLPLDSPADDIRANRHSWHIQADPGLTVSALEALQH